MVIHDDFSDLFYLISPYRPTNFRTNQPINDNVLVLFWRLGFTSWGGVAGVFKRGRGRGGVCVYIYMYVCVWGADEGVGDDGGGGGGNIVNSLGTFYLTILTLSWSKIDIKSLLKHFIFLSFQGEVATHQYSHHKISNPRFTNPMYTSYIHTCYDRPISV